MDISHMAYEKRIITRKAEVLNIQATEIEDEILIEANEYFFSA
jgi:hypothetical protein